MRIEPSPPSGEAAAQHVRERSFHDGWAAGTAIDAVQVAAAFENVTAPENRFILARMGPLAGQRLLDVGSGLGESAVYFALRGARVTATDISPEMVALCRRTAEAHGTTLDAVVTPAEQLAVEPGAFDLVYGANILHHVSDVDAVLAAAARALRPGGRCFFWDPLAYNPVINSYRRLAHQVRTEDERPLRFEVLHTFRRHFTGVGHREFWLSTLSLFLKYYLLDRLDPNQTRYWKRILEEDPRRIGWWFSPLQRLDAALLRLPLMRRLAWNIVVWGQKAA